MNQLSVENLLLLSDLPVRDRVQDVFRQQVEYADPVHDVFFHQAQKPEFPATDQDWVNRVATALVCSSIAGSSLYGFSGTVHRDRAEATWREALDPRPGSPAAAASTALYAWAFPAHCQADGVCFADYQNDQPATWGCRLAATVTDQPYLDALRKQIESGDPAWRSELDLVLYKIALLAPDEQGVTLKTWQEAFPDQEIHYTPPGHDCISPELFTGNRYLAQVTDAIAAFHTQPSTPERNYVVVTYGPAVAEFVTGPGAALATGAPPENRVILPLNLAEGCFVAGTPVLVADGDRLVEVPIEQVAAGDAVISEHGIRSRCTSEWVELHADHDVFVYGINDVEPFFSAGHLFRTPQGWRAVDPEIALGENPDRAVAPLREGDVVFLAVVDGAGARIDTRQVRVDRITQRRVEAGTSLYGLHLDGATTYHAHGFCVGANYPQFTERRLADGFARLSADERELVRSALDSVMPLLTRALGGFVATPLTRALAGTSPTRPPTPRSAGPVADGGPAGADEVLVGGLVG